MRAKETEAISGMHMPSGENLWASPADDEEVEEEDDIKKEALGLTGIPGEQSKDYQLEQPFHIKDPDNVGVIDVDTVVDLHPTNKAEDSEAENTMDKLLSELVDELDKRGYKEQAILVKESQSTAGTLAAGGAGSALGLLAGIIPGINMIPAPLRMALGGTAGMALYRYLSGNPEEKDRATQLADQIMELAQKLVSYGANDQDIEDLIDHKVKPGDLPVRMGDRLDSGWFGSRNQAVLEVQKIAADFVRVSDQFRALTEKGESATQVARTAPKRTESPALSGWAKYVAHGPIYKQFADAWQSSPPEGFTADYGSFGRWYNKTKDELGRHFGPEEALKMIQKAPEEVFEPEATPEPESMEGVTTEQPATEAPADQVAGESPIAPNSDNVKGSVERLLRGASMDTMDGERVFESGRIRRMTRRLLRSISGDRTIGNAADQEKAIVAATEAVLMGSMDGRSFEEAITAETAGMSAQEARPVFDGIVFQFLQRVSGREGMERRTQRRLRRMQRRSER